LLFYDGISFFTVINQSSSLLARIIISWDNAQMKRSFLPWCGWGCNRHARFHKLHSKDCGEREEHRRLLFT
jgi:hypothetical protein